MESRLEPILKMEFLVRRANALDQHIVANRLYAVAEYGDDRHGLFQARPAWLAARRSGQSDCPPLWE